MAALEEGQLDIGRAMALASAPADRLPELIARAGFLSQAEIKTEVAAAKLAERRLAVDTSSDERYARIAKDALQRVQSAQGPVREILAQAQRELSRILAECAFGDVTT
jgi:hypothetical protein